MHAHLSALDSSSRPSLIPGIFLCFFSWVLLTRRWKLPQGVDRAPMGGVQVFSTVVDHVSTGVLFRLSLYRTERKKTEYHYARRTAPEVQGIEHNVRRSSGHTARKVSIRQSDQAKRSKARSHPTRQIPHPRQARPEAIRTRVIVRNTALMGARMLPSSTLAALTSVPQQPDASANLSPAAPPAPTASYPAAQPTGSDSPWT